MNNKKNIDMKPIIKAIKYKGEKWKIYPLKNAYYISSYGRVLSRKRGILLNPAVSNKGYRYITLDDNKKTYIHRMVATAFCDNPDSKPIVHHINGYSWDNRACNLMWVTEQEHIALHKAIKKSGEVA